MIVVVFRSRPDAAAGEDYEATSARMEELAVTMPGYIAHKEFAAEDGERLTLVEFESEETVAALAHASGACRGAAEGPLQILFRIPPHRLRGAARAALQARGRLTIP
jgi:heme-degrading monooxygenase HmoA